MTKEREEVERLLSAALFAENEWWRGDMAAADAVTTQTTLMSAIDRALAERDARIAVLEREVRSKRRSVKNLLSIIDDHKIDLNDPESSCYRIASYEKDGDAWPPKAAEQPWTQTQLEGQMIAESGEPS